MAPELAGLTGPLGRAGAGTAGSVEEVTGARSGEAGVAMSSSLAVSVLVVELFSEQAARQNTDAARNKFAVIFILKTGLGYNYSTLFCRIVPEKKKKPDRTYRAATRNCILQI